MMATRKQKPRDYYRYHFKIGNTIMHSGITQDLARRESEHKGRWPTGHIAKVGPTVTEETAREWEKTQSKA